MMRLAAIMLALDRARQGTLCLLVLRALALRRTETQQFCDDNSTLPGRPRLQTRRSQGRRHPCRASASVPCGNPSRNFAVLSIDP